MVWILKLNFGRELCKKLTCDDLIGVTVMRALNPWVHCSLGNVSHKFHISPFSGPFFPKPWTEGTEVGRKLENSKAFSWILLLSRRCPRPLKLLYLNITCRTHVKECGVKWRELVIRKAMKVMGRVGEAMSTPKAC